MMVARHEVPGKRVRATRPVGHGMISDRRLGMFEPIKRSEWLGYNSSHRTLRDGHTASPFQALRAWLPSSRPYGTGLCLLAFFMLVTPISADSPAARGDASPAPSTNPYTIVNHMGEADQQVRLLEDKLLAHRRTIDPFGIAIRGKFKGLPPVEQHPQPTNLPVQAVKAGTNELTLEKAIQQLPVGAVNITDREALIGFQSIHEGDLLVLELSGHRFVLWVESIDRRGVQFCDINLQHHALKPFRFGPTQLPQASATGRSDVRDFLKQDGN